MLSLIIQWVKKFQDIILYLIQKKSCMKKMYEKEKLQ